MQNTNSSISSNNGLTVVDEFVGGSNTDPAAQSRAIATGLNKVGQLLRLGANALEKNAELEAQNAELEEKVANSEADPMVDVKCPGCEMTFRYRRSGALAEMAALAKVHIDLQAKDIKRLNNEIDRLSGQVYGFEKDVERLENELKAMTSQRDSLLKNNASEAFRARLVAKLEENLEDLKDTNLANAWSRGYDTGYGSALGDVKNFEKARPNEALPAPAPTPAPTPPPTPAPVAKKFKVGQKVRCVNRGSNTGISNGTVYVVTEVGSGLDADMIRVKNNRGDSEFYYQHRFEIVEGAPPATKFNPGDRVCCIAANCDIDVGWEGEVERVEHMFDKEYVYVKNPPKGMNGFYPWRFELVKAAPGVTPAVLDAEMPF